MRLRHYLLESSVHASYILIRDRTVCLAFNVITDTGAEVVMLRYEQGHLQFEHHKSQEDVPLT